MVGVSRAGKTVFLSQLIKYITDYGQKIGLSIVPANDSSTQFVELHPVKKQQSLPGGTPPGHFEQPLCFQLEKRIGTQIKKSTIVLYDVAGEVLVQQDIVEKFAPFISHSDGVIYIVDPEQFENVATVYDRNLEERVKPELVLNQISGYLRNPALEKVSELRKQNPGLIGEEEQRMVNDELRQIPIAVVLSKVDERNVLDAMLASDPDCNEAIKELGVVLGQNGRNQSVFNAKAYNKLGKALNTFVSNNAGVLRANLDTHFTDFAFFAVSSLGCSCENVEVDGRQVFGPIDMPRPKRIEEPFYWLLYKFGLLEADEEVYSPADKFNVCPRCSSVQTEDYDVEEDPAFNGLFKNFNKEYKEKKNHSLRCRICKYTW